MKCIRLTMAMMLSLLWSCTPAQKNEKAQAETVVSLLDPADFKTKLAADTGSVLVDVRTPGEVNEGIIPGAVVMDYNAPDFSSKIAALDKRKTYFVYCKVGGRSGKTVELMESSGFKEVVDLKGGYLAWVEKGYDTKKP